MATTANTTPIMLALVGVKTFQVAISDTTAQDAFTGGTDGSRFDKVWATNSDNTNPRDLEIYLKESGGSSNCIGIVEIPADAGHDTAIPQVDVLNSLGLDEIIIGEGDIIQCLAPVALTSVIHLTAFNGGNFNE